MDALEKLTFLELHVDEFCQVHPASEWDGDSSLSLWKVIQGMRHRQFYFVKLITYKIR